MRILPGKKQLFLTALLWLGIMTLWPHPAACQAQAETLESKKVEAETHSISSEVLSPFCPGRSLNDCPSASAADLRRSISSMLSSGMEREEVLNALYERYGDEIRALPKKEGFGLVAWYSPAAFLLLGFAILYFWLSRHRNAGGTAAASKTSELTPEMKRRIEGEISGTD